MLMPIDIDKKEFTRDKRGYNSREVDEFLDLIIVDYEKVLSDNRNMAHKIKTLEKQLEEAQKTDTAMLDTLETAKRLMADISASAERRAELMIRDAELEAENIILEAKATVKSMNEEHLTLSSKVKRLRENYESMLRLELEKLQNDEYGLLPEMDRSDIPDIESQFSTAKEPSLTNDTIVVMKDGTTNVSVESPKQTGKTEATVNDLSESLRQMVNSEASLDDTLILK